MTAGVVNVGSGLMLLLALVKGDIGGESGAGGTWCFSTNGGSIVPDADDPIVKLS